MLDFISKNKIIDLHAKSKVTIKKYYNYRILWPFLHSDLQDNKIANT